METTPLTISKRTRDALDSHRATVAREHNAGVNLQRYIGDVCIDTEQIIVHDGAPYLWACGPSGTHTVQLTTPNGIYAHERYTARQYAKMIHKNYGAVLSWYVWPGEGSYRNPRSGQSELTPIGNIDGVYLYLDRLAARAYTLA